MQVSHLHPKQQRLVAHDVLIDPEGGHPGEAGLITGEALEYRADRAPQRLPGGPKLACESLDLTSPTPSGL